MGSSTASASSSSDSFAQSTPAAVYCHARASVTACVCKRHALHDACNGPCMQSGPRPKDVSG